MLPLKLTREHLVPQSLGGNNKKVNLRICCHECNHWRGNKPLAEWQLEVAHILFNKKKKFTLERNDLRNIIKSIDVLNEYVNKSADQLRKEIRG